MRRLSLQSGALRDNIERPTLVDMDGDLNLSVAGSSGGPILIYRLPAGGSWLQFVSGIHDSSGKAITVRSFAQLYAYADGRRLQLHHAQDRGDLVRVPVIEGIECGEESGVLADGPLTVVASMVRCRALPLPARDPFHSHQDSGWPGERFIP